MSSGYSNICSDEKVVDSDKIWASLITNDAYLPGLLTLAFSLRRVGSKYPLVALHTGTLPDATVRALSARDIPLQRVPYLHPQPPRETEAAGSEVKSTMDGDTDGSDTDSGWYAHDPRFRDCFTKLAVFSLTGYSRIVLLDADMLVRRNMDELFDLPLDQENRLFAATHACVCNPLHLPHYPRDWTPAHCAFTAQHADPDLAQADGGRPDAGMGLLNGGLLAISPSAALAAAIRSYLRDARRASPARLPFADQSLLGDLFAGRWAALPYVYNALRTMRRGLGRVRGRGRGRGRRGGHGAVLWRDGEVRNVHYILTPKPWEAETGEARGRDVAEGKRGREGDGKGGDDAGMEGTEEEEGEEEETTGQERQQQQSAAMEDDDNDDGELDRWWREVDLERRAWEAERGLKE